MRIYFIITPGNKISPRPKSEHFNKGVLRDCTKEGNMNFIGKSIDVATEAMTEVPKNIGLMNTQNIS